jgi:hypothetical protein
VFLCERWWWRELGVGSHGEFKLHSDGSESVCSKSKSNLLRPQYARRMPAVWNEARHEQGLANPARVMSQALFVLARFSKLQPRMRSRLDRGYETRVHRIWTACVFPARPGSSSALDSELPALPRTKSTSASTDPDIVGQLHQNQDPVTCICKSFLSGC